MLCEGCRHSHDGSYASGRFCCEGCARGSSRRTLIKKQPKSSESHKAAISAAYKAKRDALPFLKKPKSERFRIVLEEQGGKCLECGCGSMWNGKPLRLQLDHISGDNKDNTRNNLRILCPNCHTQTPTWGYKSREPKLLQPKINKKLGEKNRLNTDKRWEPFKEKIISSDIDFSRFGWRQQVADILGITPHSVGRWMKRYLPEVQISRFKSSMS